MPSKPHEGQEIFIYYKPWVNLLQSVLAVEVSAQEDRTYMRDQKKIKDSRMRKMTRTMAMIIII